MLNKKISSLVPKQLPGFVTEEYPRFVSFLEAYYEFLEKEHPELNISNNNLLEQVEKLKYVSDVDESLEQFEDHFFSSFLPYFSKNSAANKDIIIKNILPLYLAKGSEKSFKLLFRMLFDESVKLTYPRDNILRASDGKWYSQKILSISDSFYTIYIADGQTTDFNLPEVYNLEDFTVYLNSVEITNFTFLKEYKKIVFDSAVSAGSEIKIVYNKFDATLLKNRLIEGLTTKATCIVEYVNKTRTGIVPFYEVFVDSKNLSGTFSNNELLKSSLIDGVNIPIYFKPYSILEKIEVISGGASYNVGDIVPVYGESDQDAIIIVDSVFSGVVDNINVSSGGAGFKVNNLVYAPEYGLSFFTGNVASVDSSGVNSANTLTLNNDVISNAAAFLISGTYSFFPANTISTVNTAIGNTLSNVTISGLGSIASVDVGVSLINSTLTPAFEVRSSNVTSQLTIQDFGVIGIIDVLDGGENYANGEYLMFTDNGSFRGYGANAQVQLVDGNGTILKIKINSGGLNYDKLNLPTISVNTVSGTGASLAVTALMGDGESLSAVYSGEPAGKIRSLKLVYPGLNYTKEPLIDLTQLGNGLATANATIKNSLKSSSGRWRNDEGKLSNRNIRLQGKDYFIDFSYVITAGIEFKKYKEIVKNLLHPAGLVNYSKYAAPEVECSSILNINIENPEDLLTASISADSTAVTVDTTSLTADQT